MPGQKNLVCKYWSKVPCLGVEIAGVKSLAPYWCVIHLGKVQRGGLLPEIESLESWTGMSDCSC